MKQRSAKGQEFEDELDRMRPLVLARSRGYCECGQGCGRQGETVHHRKRRTQGGTNELDNLLHLSFICHLFVHANPSWSYERGLMLRGYQPVTSFWVR